MTQDTRWVNPDHLPLTNGPIRTVTAPVTRKFALDSDGQEIEYLLPYPMHIVDPSPWRPLEFVREGTPLRVQRPIFVMSTYEPDGRIGNEAPDAYCTIIRVRTPVGTKLGGDDGWKVIEALLRWIRIKSRHFWLLHGITGFGALYRGSVLTRQASV